MAYRPPSRSALGAAGALLLTLWVTSATAAGVVVRLDVDGTVDPAVLDYLEEGIERAFELDAEAVILRLDTPGGLVDTTRLIVQRELESPVTIVVWVAPTGARAGSAGVFLTMAAHVAAMAPGTNIGAATPIFIGPDGDGAGEGTGGNREAMRRKSLEDTRAFARAIAEVRGRPSDWIESTVTQASSYTSLEALEAGAIDIIASTEAELLEALHGRAVTVAGSPRSLDTRGASVVRLEMRLGQKLLHFLAHPLVAQLLLLLGLLAIYVELSAPGGYVVGTIGVIALVLAVIAFQILPFDTGGLILVLLGLGLLVLEAFLPTLGLVALAGLTSLVIGSLMLWETPDLTLRPHPAFVVTIAVLGGLGVILVGILVLRSQRRPTELGVDAMLGLRAEVIEALAPAGLVAVRGEIWQADLVDAEHLDAGATVTVTAIEGLRLTVAPAPQEEEPEP